MERVKQAFERVTAAALAAFKTPGRAASTLSLSLLIFFVFAFNTNIPWNTDLLGESVFNAWKVMLNGYASFLVAGSLRLFSVVLYSLLVSMAVTNFGVQLLGENLNMGSLATVLPGFVAGGCGCGIGLLGLLGLGGATLALPFNGELIVLAGIALVTYALYDMGDPEVCDVKVSAGL
ncbi:MAG: hypothetical protein ABEJ98_02505 [Candidatus Nanohaloarchaea archaeon]